jgi:hypothetical protein
VGVVNCWSQGKARVRSCDIALIAALRNADSGLAVVQVLLRHSLVVLCSRFLDTKDK